MNLENICRPQRVEIESVIRENKSWPQMVDIGSDLEEHLQASEG